MERIAEALAKPSFQLAAKNMGWLVAERGIRLFLGVVVGFVVARYLGPESLGSLSYCVAIVTLVSVASGLGLEAVVKRDVIVDPSGSPVLAANAFVLRLAAGILAYGLLLAWLAIRPPPANSEHHMVAALGLMLMQPSLMISDLWLQANLKARYSVLGQTIGLAAAAAVRIGLVVAGASLVYFAFAVVVESLVGAAMVWILAGKAGFSVDWGSRSLAGMRKLLSESWPLAFAGLAIVVYMKIDEVMLRHIAGAREVGYYSAATRLTEIWYFFPTALAGSLLPALLRSRERGDEAYRERLQQYYDLNAAVGYALSVPLALASGWIVRLAYGEAFAPSAPIVSIHVWSSIFVFIGVARGQWLVNERLQRFYLMATLAGAGVNIGLNLVFIPRWGASGAAFATVISQAIAAWGSSFALASTRDTAWMQTRALCVPFLGLRYLRRA